MRVTPRRIVVPAIVRMGFLTGFLLLACQAELRAERIPAGIVARDNISNQQRNELVGKLRRITGFRELAFDYTGFLKLGNSDSIAGSRTARTLVSSAIFGSNLVVLEDASRRPDVVFSRVVHGRWRSNAQSNLRAYIVLIDFADFDHVMGDRRALSAFDSAWAVLHELDHIVNDSWDPDSQREPGDCVAHINRMRQECNVPLRAEYFFTLLPQSNDSIFKSRFVRLAFAELDSVTKRTKRYWVMWDASLVGGLDDRKQIAAR